MDFVSIDVETANADMASICQIGVAHYSNGKLAKEWKTYVDPQDDFDGINIYIHGIDERKVRGAPTFGKIASMLDEMLSGQVVVTHTFFDRTAIHQAAVRCGAIMTDYTWLDTARVARRTWPECIRKGYGLANVCEMLGYSFKHHDALEDAKAAANILLEAIARTDLDIEGWLKRVRQPIGSHGTDRITREANIEGPLYGEIVVFTGALEMPRREAADLAASVGCQVDGGVTQKTTILVVGDQDIKRLAGHNKSSKQRKAEMLAERGQELRIIGETDFRQMVGLAA